MKDQKFRERRGSIKNNQKIKSLVLQQVNRGKILMKLIILFFVTLSNETITVFWYFFKQKYLLFP